MTWGAEERDEDDRLASRILSSADATREPAAALRELLDRLTDANLQEDEDDDGSDERYEIKKRAEALLFIVATEWAKKRRGGAAVTNPAGNGPGEVPADELERVAGDKKGRAR